MSAQAVYGSILAVALTLGFVPQEVSAQGRGHRGGHARSNAGAAQPQHAPASTQAPRAGQSGAATAGADHRAEQAAQRAQDGAKEAGAGSAGDGQQGPPERPTGWDEGEKVGWGDCSAPPGLESKSGCTWHGSTKGAQESHGTARPNQPSGESQSHTAPHAAPPAQHGGSPSRHSK
jgi:hypothetical protein